jgi:hypothetical protein
MFNLLQDNELLSISADIETFFKDELSLLDVKDADEVQLIFEKQME